MPYIKNPEIIRAKFIRQFGEQPYLYQAPGRINIIGEHTDYNHGLVLPATVDLMTWAAVAPRDDHQLRIHLCIDNSSHHINLDDIQRGEKGKSVEYLKAVAWALSEEGVALRGCNIMIGGNIPIGGGLSSSASLELLLAFALLDIAGLEMDRDRLARICQHAEYEFVGVQCGIMDQFTVALGERQTALLLDCRSLEYELIPIPESICFLITHSGVSHQLPAGDYNSRRDECVEAVKALSAVLATDLESLRELSLQQLEQYREVLRNRLYRRCKHVLTENIRTRQAGEALKNRDLARLGALLSQSHTSLRDDYEVSCPELDSLVAIAEHCEGVLGSRMMGGGFGGCTISLVKPDAVEDVKDRICTEYGRLLGHTPWMHVVGPANPVSPLEN